MIFFIFLYFREADPISKATVDAQTILLVESLDDTASLDASYLRR